MFITATPDSVAPQSPTSQPLENLPTATQGPTLTPTQLPLPTASGAAQTQQHIVASGETLFAIAQLYNTTIDTLETLNSLDNSDLIFVGQQLSVPGSGDLVSPSLILLSDLRYIRGPESHFDVSSFVQQQAGYISRAADTFTHRKADGSGDVRFLNGAQIVEQVSLETSIDARVLLAILEYRAGWLTNPSPQEIQWPLISQEASIGVDRAGLYRQLSWVANELNRGYYGWKYADWSALEFSDGPRIQFDTSLNAASVALHYFMHLNRTPGDWLHDISVGGWAATYYALFGGQMGASENTAIIPPPTLALPYAQGETWLFTGGPHGGWGTGSAWAALDFAPPDGRTADRLCYTSRFPARAVADGIIARSADGAVVLDLDGDGDERTGWSILYLHLDTSTTVSQGQRVRTGDIIGHPACEGGYSTATHLHIARRYNGEWIPADCTRCAGPNSFTMSGWLSIGIPGQEYQGSLQRGADMRTAEQSYTDPINQVRYD